MLPCGPFEFELPPKLEASEPPEARGLARDGVRLMVSRIDDDSVTHAQFRDIGDFLRAGDVLEEVYRTNVIAPLGLLQEVHARDALKGNGRIIDVTSDAGVEAYPGWGGYGSSKAALEQLSAVFAVENPEIRVYWIDPGDMRTQMHQDAFPGEDISDRPPPEDSVPGLLALICGELPSGRYQARALGAPA